MCRQLKVARVANFSTSPPPVHMLAGGEYQDFKMIQVKSYLVLSLC
jgi:hypothetical protein